METEQQTKSVEQTVVSQVDQQNPQEEQNSGATTEEKEPETTTFPVNIKTCGEQKTTVQLQVSPADNIQDIKQFLYESIETCFITHYHFHINGVKVNDYADVQDIPEIKADCTLEMVEAPYDERSIRLHVRRLRDIISSAEANSSSSLFSHITADGEDLSTIAPKDEKDQQKSVVTIDEKDIQIDNDSSLSKFYSQMTEIPPTPCVKSITFSGWNPPPSYRKLQGDLIYLEITTLENRTMHVTGSTNGFFINASNVNFNPNPIDKPCYAHSLAVLLNQSSALFKKNFQTLLNTVFQRHPFEMFPVLYPLHAWIKRKEKHNFDMNRAEDAILWTQDTEMRGQLRDWNEEYQTMKELPRETIQQRIIRDRNICKFNAEFVEAAIKGARAIVERTVTPINPLDPERAHMYIFNNIFFSYAVDGRDFFKEFGGDKAAFVSVSNDLKGIRLMNAVDVKGLYTLATAIVDYRGHRVVAQSIIPGILQREQTSNVVYGSIDNGKTINSDPAFHELMVQAAKALHIKEHTVLDAEGKEHKLCAPVESKGIVGTDSRKYILDLVRFTPRDANYSGKTNVLTILRPELVQTYYEHLRQKELKEREKEKKESENPEQQAQQGEEQKKEEAPKEEQAAPAEETAQPTTTENGTAEETKPEPEIELKGFNPNGLCEYKLGGNPEEIADDEETVKAMSTFLKDTIIPILVDEMMWLLTLPVDGQTLTNLLHTHGINLRYLGMMTGLVEKNPLVRDVLLREMITRGAKHILRNLLRETDDAYLANTIAHFFNCFLGSVTDPNAQPAKNAKKKKVKSLNPNTKGLAMTSVSLWDQIVSEVKERFQYDLPERERLFSVVRTATTLRGVCQLVGIQVDAHDYDFTADMPFQAADILDLFPVVKHCDNETADGRNLLDAGKTFLVQGRLDIAYELLNEALAIFHQVYGPMHRDTASCYSNLATVMYHAKDIAAAIDNQQKAVIIHERVLGLDHHDTAQGYSNLALFCHQVGKPKLSLSFINRALYLNRFLAGPTHPDTATIYTNIAMFLQELQHQQHAVFYLMEALKCYETLLGPSHLQTAAIYHAIALAYSQMGQFKDALNYEKKNYAILHEKLGDADIRTVESNICLKQFTAKAVQAQIETKKTQRDITAQLSQSKLEKLKVNLPSSKAVSGRGTSAANVPMGARPLNEVMSFINGKSAAGKSFAERNKKIPSASALKKAKKPTEE